MELWDAYDENGVKTGEILVRGEAIPEGRYHLVSCVVVRHVDGDFLLMLRSPEKENYPNVWEIGAGGSAVQGESGLECARRELLEETGIDRGTLTATNFFRSRDTIYAGFLCQTDYPKDQIRLQAGETVDYRWVSREAFIRFYDSGDCVPPLKLRLREFVDNLR